MSSRGSYPIGRPSGWISLFGKLGVVGSAAFSVAVFIVVAVVIGPWLWTIDPNETNLSASYAHFSTSHPLGADEYGRDLLSRLLHGGRLSLLGASIVLLGETTLEIGRAHV